MPGEKALTPKQAAFARAYLEHGNASLAYKMCYKAEGMNDASVNRMAHDVLHNPKVKAEIEKIQAQALKKTSTTLEDLVAELDKAAQLAQQTSNATAYATAIMHKAKLLGLVTDKAEVRTGALDPDEARPDISSIWARAVADEPIELETTKH
jgi:phage terminase small subunit